VRGWVAVVRGPAAWPHTAANPPAVTLEDRRNEQAARASRMVDQALAQGGDRAEQFKKGMVGRLHYLETVEPIKQFKREGRLAEALALCYGAIDAAENAREGREPAPWYTEQAAIIHRRLGEHDKEESVLRRWLDACPPERRDGSRIKLRLDKLGSSPYAPGLCAQCVRCVLPVPATDRKTWMWLWWPHSTDLPSFPRSCPTLRLGGWVKGRGSARVSDAAGALEAATQGAGSSVGCRRGRERNPGVQREWVDDLLGGRGGDVIVMVWSSARA
jgi:hypothetical protein